MNNNTHLRLVDNNKELPLFQNEDLKKEMCIAIATGLCTVPEDLVNLFNITYEQSISLLSDPGFLTLVSKHTKAKLNLTFHTTIPSELSNILKEGDFKEKMQAIKLIAQLSDNLKNTGSDVNINLNLENLVKQAEKTIPSPILDAEFRKAG